MADKRRDRLKVTLTADLVILTIRDGRLHVLLVERANEPFQGCLALPGGFLRGRETIDEAAARELAEETGMDSADLHLEQVHVYSDPDRDPRTPRVVTCSFLAIAPNLPSPEAGSDAAAAHWIPVADLAKRKQRLAFDHDVILADALTRAGEKLQYTTIATRFCDTEFTISDLREVYEAVWGIELDRPNFHRKVTEAEDFVVATGRKRPLLAGRPALLYRAGEAKVLSPPMMRTPRGRA
ncbi:NUDIX domain-containing protein [Kibdelosporangium aridum]|uniref:NUDIX domain-containing protein n=1 Tax=Kibdelosporangium aridum TaxID=2030 RepID=A0A428YCD6_KIBAR|nr:NUDIX domain-containing protein [Kibdelosporangium aridum]RSM65234.1 NUDIX domain-containing protein [Kibdelosporangium aridum]